MMQEVVNRSMILIVNVGENEFREGIVDLNLDPKTNVSKNAQKVIRLLETQKVLLSI